MKKPIPHILILLALCSGSLNALRAKTLSDQENYLYQPQAKTPIGNPAGASEPALPAPQGQPENAGAPPQTAQNKTRLNEDDLRADPQLAERLVNQAVLERQWDFLAALLPVYQSIPAHNPTLYKYAHGALARTKAKHRQAVRDFGEILQKEPDLHYVRLDYMSILFENRQYRQAKQQADILLSDSNTPEPIRQLAEQAKTAVDKQQKWKFDGYLQYEQTDNVNDASYVRELRIGGRTFTRDPDSMPKAAHGIRYGVSANKSLNIGGNHNLVFGTTLGGVHYWDRHDYSEINTTVQGGYQYQDVRRTFSVQPFFSYDWLGGHRYDNRRGIQLSYSQWLGSRWQIGLSASHAKRYYRDHAIAKNFNSISNNGSATLAFIPKPNIMLFTGVDWLNDKPRLASQASQRKGIRIGVAGDYKDWVGARVDYRIGTRQFNAPHYFFANTTRRDIERQWQGSLWSPKLTWHGLTPKLNYRHVEIDSNIPALYSRKNGQWFMTVDKQF